MNLFAYLFVALLALGAPAYAFLGVKLALLKALSDNGGHGSGGYSGQFNQDYYTQPSRQVNKNYGSGGGYVGSSYGGGYGDEYSRGHSGRREQLIKVIKVVEDPQKQTQSSDGYRNGFPDGYSSSYTTSGSYTGAVSAPVQTYSAPAQARGSYPAPAPATYVPIQESAPVSYSFSLPQPVLSVKPTPVMFSVNAPQAVPAPITYSDTAPQVERIQSEAAPVQYPVPELLTVMSVHPAPQQYVKTIKVIVNPDDSGTHNVPSPVYGVPSPGAKSWSNGGVRYSNNGWNNAVDGSYSNGGWNIARGSSGIWEKLVAGC